MRSEKREKLDAVDAAVHGAYLVCQQGASCRIDRKGIEQRRVYGHQHSAEGDQVHDSVEDRQEQAHRSVGEDTNVIHYPPEKRAACSLPNQTQHSSPLIRVVDARRPATNPKRVVRLAFDVGAEQVVCEVLPPAVSELALRERRAHT